MISPDSHSLSSRRSIRFYDRLIIQFIKPFVEFSLHIIDASIFLWIEDLEPRIYFRHNPLKETPLGNLTALDRILLRWADHRDSRLLLNKVSDAVDYRLLRPDYPEVYLALESLSEFADGVHVQAWNDPMLLRPPQVEWVPLFIDNVKVDVIPFTSTKGVNYSRCSRAIGNDKDPDLFHIIHSRRNIILNLAVINYKLFNRESDAP